MREIWHDAFGPGNSTPPCLVSGPLDGVSLHVGKPYEVPGKPGEWNSSESGHPFLFRDDDGRTYLFYQ